MTRLIIVRHAPSISNEAGIFVGHTDVELSELGFKQAELLKDYLIKKDYKIDKIYSSDLKRPFHTVQPYARAVGKEVIPDKGLREIYAGKWEGNKFAELPELFPDSYSMWLNDIGHCVCDGGESIKEMYDRINGAIDRIASENDGLTLLIGTHATPLRALMAREMGLGYWGMKDTKWCENVSLNIFDYENGALKAVELNISEHLGALRSYIPKGV